MNSDEHVAGQAMKHAVRAEWIDAWADKAAGWCICELREYQDGSTFVHRGEPVYLADCSAEVAALFSIYMMAELRLRRASINPVRRAP